MLKILSIIGFIAATAWLFAKPGYDSLIAFISAIAVVITSFTIAKKAVPQQNQVVGEHGFAIQAGKTVKTGPIYEKPKDEK